MTMLKFLQDSASQRQRLLKWLEKKPITTVEARHQLDILGVAPRIYELRHLHGYNIQTHWATGINPGGDEHRLAQYVLLPGKYEKGAK